MEKISTSGWKSTWKFLCALVVKKNEGNTGKNIFDFVRKIVGAQTL
jgi:hypothetical protein